MHPDLLASGSQLIWIYTVSNGGLEYCIILFSSHNHEVLKVSYMDQSISVERRALFIAVCRQQFHLSDSSYFTTGPILTKLHR